MNLTLDKDDDEGGAGRWEDEVRSGYCTVCVGWA